MRLIIGVRYRDRLYKTLNQLGAEVIWMPDNPDVDPRLAGHADLSVFSTENTVIAVKGIYSYLVNNLTSRAAIIESEKRQGYLYPDDAALCACDTGKYLIYNPKTVDSSILKCARRELIPVNQGYTKCSVCVVSKDAFITSDCAIASKALQVGMDVLLVEPGHIELDGFDYGFIGGATFLINEKLLAFTGTLTAHPDREKILAFLKKHHLEPVFLTDEPIFDIGGAVALP